MKYTLTDGILTVFPEGRVDSTNAEAIGAEIEAICGENSYESFTVNAENLQYLSSAGLRIILKLRKEDPSLKIIEANSELYDIFEMTGFSELMPVEKAFRRISVEGCEVIGVGANGKVYRLDPDTIIKVYLNPESLSDIQRERELSRKAFVMGVPTAIPYDVVRVGESYGSVFELLNAKPMAKVLAEDPSRLDACVALSVEIAKKMHSVELKKGDMPEMRDVARGWVKGLDGCMPEESYEKLKALYDAVPEDYHMLHGDFHVKNIMLQNDEALLVDMDTLCMGHPVFELGAMYMAYVGFSEQDHTVVEKFLGIPFEISSAFWHKFVRQYFDGLSEEELEARTDKIRLVTYTRLMGRPIRHGGLETEEGRAMIAYYRSQIEALLQRVDSLLF